MILISISTISILISTTPSQHVIILLSPRFGRFGCLRSCPPCSAGHAAFFCSFVSHVISLLFSKQVTVRGCQCFLRVSALLRDSASAFRPACQPLSPLRPPCLPSVSGLASLLVGHCVRLVSCLASCWSLCPLCLPPVFLCLGSCLPSCWSLCPACLPSVSFCFPSCLSTIATQQLRAGRQMGMKAEGVQKSREHSSGLLCPPLPCNPLHVSPSSGLPCPPLACNPLHVSPALGCCVRLALQ